MAGDEDVEDQLRTIKHGAGQEALEVAQLRRGQVVVEDDEIRVIGGCDAGDLFDLAGTDERGGFGLAAALQNLRNDERTGALDELTKLDK